MAVYVDELINWKRVIGSNQVTNISESWCHMTADTEEELHEFAARLGLRRNWAQHAGTPKAHYDLTSLRRAQAIRLGAIQRSARDTVRAIIKKREEQ